MGGTKYPMITRDDFSRYAWWYFISQKSDAAEVFKQITAVNSTKENSDSFTGK